MSTLTEAQIEKLYGRKSQFLPSRYRMGILEELNLAIKRAMGGRFTASQVGEVVSNLQKGVEGKKLALFPIPPPRQEFRTSGGPGGRSPEEEALHGGTPFTRKTPIIPEHTYQEIRRVLGY